MNVLLLCEGELPPAGIVDGRADTLSCRAQPSLPVMPARMRFALSHAAPSVAAMIGRTDMLKPTVRSCFAARARNAAMRSAVVARGSA